MDGVLSAHREGLHRKSALLGPLWPPCKLRAGVVGLADGRQVRIGEREGRGRRFKSCFYPINHGIYVRELARVQYRKLVERKASGLLREPNLPLPPDNYPPHTI